MVRTTSFLIGLSLVTSALAIDEIIKCWTKSAENNNGKKVEVVMDKIHEIKKMTVRYTIGREAVCTEDESYGYHGNTFWVGGTCKASFSICGTKATKCQKLYMKGTPGERYSREAYWLDQVGYAALDEIIARSGLCKYGETYGYEGLNVWTQGQCVAFINACTRPPKDALSEEDREIKEEQMRKERLLLDVHGNLGDTAKEIEKNLIDGMKDRNRDACMCSVFGNTHFVGFDKNLVSFDGECDYTMARSSVSSDCDFHIGVENERISSGKSKVKQVNIQMFGGSFSLQKNATVVWNDLTRDAVVGKEGMFRTVPGDIQAITFYSEKCGLKLTFKDNDRVVLVLSKDHRKKVEGLCGNCNGDPEDDYVTPDGDLVKGTPPHRDLEVADSWAIGDCPYPTESTCSESALSKAKELCAPLNAAKGPFQTCYEKSGHDFSSYYAGCVQSLCPHIKDSKEEVNKRRCRAFSIVADRCQFSGYPVDWREDTRCDLRCPANSQPFVYTPACQWTCFYTTLEPFCTQDASDGCLCDKGYVLHDGECIAWGDCACKTGFFSYPIGDYVLRSHCTKKVTCVDHDNKKSTKPIEEKEDYACSEDGYCGVVDGRTACVCKHLYIGDGLVCNVNQTAVDEERRRRERERQERDKNYYICNAWGDPHFGTYDGDDFDFQGRCTYLLSATPTQGGPCDFSLVVKLKSKDHKPRVTFLHKVYISTRGITITLRKGNLIQVNGFDRKVPINLPDEGIRIIQSGPYIHVLTECGVVFAYKTDTRLKINLPKKMGGDMKGMCGNANGVPEEWILTDGTDVSEDPLRDVLYATDFLVDNPDHMDDDENCDLVESNPVCEDDDVKAANSSTQCGRFIDVDGPFGECVTQLVGESIHIRDLHKGCVLDACVFQDVKEALEEVLCAAAEELAQLCINKGFPVSWRTRDFCALECQDNAFYTPQLYGCQPTCIDPKQPTSCNISEVEGCQCEEGLLLDNGECVHPDECGCLDIADGTYMPRGTSFYSNDCSVKYKCEATSDGSILTGTPLDQAPCSEHATCSLDDKGGFHCTCKEGYEGNGVECEKAHEKPDCFCVINDDPRVVQFDGGKLKVDDPCKFTLAATKSKGQCSFAVEVKVATKWKIKKPYMLQADVMFDDVTVRLDQDKEMLIKSEDGTFNPVKLTGFRRLTRTVYADKNDTIVSVHSQCGVDVTFDGIGEVTVKVSPRYTDSSKGLRGLCGDCDGDRRNDRMSPGGKLPEAYSDLATGFSAVTKQFLVHDDSSQPGLSDVCP